MAVFEKNWDQADLAWETLQVSPFKSYASRDALEEDIEWYQEHKYVPISLNTADWITDDVMHEELRVKFNFPDYYGMNLDALDDCLEDLEIPVDSGYVIILNSFDSLLRSQPDLVRILIRIFARKAWYHLLFGMRLIVLLSVDDPNFVTDGPTLFDIDWNESRSFRQRHNL